MSTGWNSRCGLFIGSSLLFSRLPGRSRPFALLSLLGLDEKLRQLRDRIAGRRRARDGRDIFVEPRDRLEHVAARGALFEEMADLLHLRDPAIGFRIHAGYLPGQPGEEM